MGWSQGDVNQLNSPLDSLAGKQPQSHPALQALIQILASEPNLDPSFSQGLLSQAMANIQAQQAQGQQNRTDLRSGLTGLAQSGTPMEGAQGYAGAMYPGMANKPFVGNALDQLYPGGGTSPLAPPTDPSLPQPGALDADSAAGIDQDVKAMATGLDGDGVPLATTYTMHSAVMHVIQNLRAQGVTDEATLETARKYVEQRWAEYKGYGMPQG